MHSAVVAVARAPTISRLTSVVAVSFRERRQDRQVCRAASSSAPMNPVVELYQKVHETLPADPVATPAGESHFRAVAPYMNAVEPRHLAMEPPSTSRRSSSDSADSARPAQGFFSQLFGRASSSPSRSKSRSKSMSRASAIDCVTLHDSHRFSMSVFRFNEEGTTIPLHNHPHMTVMSRLLYGTLRVRAFDWADDDKGVPGTSPNTPRLARLVRDESVSAPAEAFALYPRHGGNIHVFTATEPAAVLDILAPPYAIGSGRDCHYFEEVQLGPSGARAPPGHAWLVEVDCPDDFEVERGEYDGPLFGSRARGG